jgi:hypothetical protein
MTVTRFAACSTVLAMTFEEIGLSAEDVIEAATIPNPKIDLAIRFPDTPPSGTCIDYSAAIDFLSHSCPRQSSKKGLSRGLLFTVGVDPLVCIVEMVGPSRSAGGGGDALPCTVRYIVYQLTQ